MKIIKKILARILSQKAYLRTLHFVFYVLYDLRLLRGDKRFKYHYLIRKIIQEDFVVIDIGANLGYFAKNFSRLARNGKVIAIEPVPAFYSVLTHFLGNKNNVEIHNVALGKEDGIITMVMPESDGFIRTGLPHIATSDEEKRTNKTQEVKIVKAKEFVGKIPKIDYIKCDIEGYEKIVFEELKPLLEEKRPLVQLEISEQNKEQLLDIFKEIDYIQFGVSNFKFVQENGKQQEEGDYFFVPSEKLNYFHKLVE
ncbi:MAG: FkbM family methyltransferase [Bacteroidetes bacterium]|nr:FkbM family methyltransferase [Bacteroidota bacterium]